MKKNIKLKKVIKKVLRQFLNENYNSFSFNDFPENVLKTLKNEYFFVYQNNFDWNSKQDEFIKDGVYDGNAFKKWLENNEKEEFLKNLNKLITLVRQDLILKIKQKNADNVLKNFEELIIPVLGNEILIEPISKYLETALLVIGSNNTDINHIQKELSKAYHNSKNIIDSDGSINYEKITQSTLFNNDVISLPSFERFVKKNPEYTGVFNDWKKIYDISLELSLKDLNAYRNSISYLEIKNLYNFLIDFRKKNNGFN